ncbi:MAG: adenylate/guanylate cyclase domain-containing protein, partial [Spirulina sp.]
ALAMQGAISAFPKEQLVQFMGDRPLQIRIGIGTGSVVAGVIGQKKFIYDLWGDTVNVASRMESQGEAGKIQVTERVYQGLGECYNFEERGRISVKGRGEMTTYWLLSKKNPSNSPTGEI